MDDLINLDSPIVKNQSGTKLMSPLIPLPPSTTERQSLGDNPFDMVLLETIKYTQKQEDPFEIVLEKCLKSNKPEDVCTNVNVNTETCEINRKGNDPLVLDVSSNPVLIETSELMELVPNEVKVLARTFEELAQNSAEWDLLEDDPNWTSELLPAFDDEGINNLSELSLLYNKNNRSIELTTKCDINSTSTQKSCTQNEKILDENNHNNVDTKITVSALLTYLKKAIQPKNNNEAYVLLEKLEKALDIEHNTESISVTNSNSSNTEILKDETTVVSTNKSVSTNVESLDNCETSEKALIKLGNLLKESAAVDLLRNLVEILSSASNDENKKSNHIYDSNNVETITATNKNLNSDNITNKNKTQQVIPSKLKAQSNSHLLSKVESSVNKLSLKRVYTSSTVERRISGLKRYSSGPNLIDSSTKEAVNARIKITNNEFSKIKDTQHCTKIEINKQDKGQCNIERVNSKLNMKVGSKSVNRKGPMRAVTPIRNMQKINMATTSKLNKNSAHPAKIMITTPNPAVRNSLKRIVASTPEIQKHEHMQRLSCNVSCNMSPLECTEAKIIQHKNNYRSPNKSKISDSSSPNKVTPNNNTKVTSVIPKYFTSPRVSKRNSLYDDYKSEYSKSIENQSKKMDNKTLPNIKKSATKGIKVPQKSPLREIINLL